MRKMRLFEHCDVAAALSAVVVSKDMVDDVGSSALVLVAPGILLDPLEDPPGPPVFDNYDSSCLDLSSEAYDNCLLSRFYPKTIQILKEKVLVNKSNDQFRN